MSDSEVRLKQTTSSVVFRLAFWLVGIGLAMVCGLALMGRSWWCGQADIVPWSWDIWSPHCSQHFTDPYSLSHFQHGLSLFLILSLTFGNRISLVANAATVAVIEALWELAENTSFIINRYREATVSLDYYGDSIANSTGDYLFCLLGVYVAYRLPPKVVVGIFVAAEVISLLWIRDSLMINIVMLISPIDAIKEWQMPG